MPAFENFSGKINASFFKKELLGLTGFDRPELLQGPAFGVDTAVIDLGDSRSMVVSSDPLSIIPGLGMEVSAWLSVHLIINDMCTSGFSPQYAQFVLNLSPDLSRSDFSEYWHHIHLLCEQYKIAITGGHTGQIPGQNSTIAGGATMFLIAPKSQIICSNNAKEGDTIIMTKSAAISSTSLLSMAFPEKVRNDLGPEIQQKAANNFWQLSVWKESQIAAKILQAHHQLRAMHDVTEGGILGGIEEMAIASHLGFEVDVDKIPLAEEAKAIADLFAIDPLFSIGAGSMLMAVNPADEARLLEALNNENIDATSIGRFTKAEKKIIRKNGREENFEFDGNDPYWEAFMQGVSNQWR